MFSETLNRSPDSIVAAHVRRPRERVMYESARLYRQCSLAHRFTVRKLLDESAPQTDSDNSDLSDRRCVEYPAETVSRGRGRGVHALRLQEFWAVFEMHGVEVVPLAAPDEALGLKDVHHLFRETITIHIASRFFIRLRPVPIVSVLHAQIDGDGKAVHALALGPFHVSPIEGPRRGFEIPMETLGEAVERVGDALQFEVDVMDGTDPQSSFLLAGGPSYVGAARPDLFRSRAIHLEEERLIAHPPRFKVHRRWLAKAV